MKYVFINLHHLLFVSSQGLHIPAEALNGAANIMLKYFTNDSFAIETINYPLPRNAQSQVRNQLTYAISALGNADMSENLNFV